MIQQEFPAPVYVPYAPRNLPQEVVHVKWIKNHPPSLAPLAAVEIPTQGWDPAPLTRNAKIIARSFSTARRFPTTREYREHAGDILEIAADDE